MNLPQLLPMLLSGDTAPIDDFVRKIDHEWRMTKDDLTEIREESVTARKIAEENREEIQVINEKLDVLKDVLTRYFENE